MEDLLLRPLADAFLQVGVPVALLAAAAAWARVRYGVRALDVLVRHPRARDRCIAAALGVSPGCGGRHPGRRALPAGQGVVRRGRRGADRDDGRRVVRHDRDRPGAGAGHPRDPVRHRHWSPATPSTRSAWTRGAGGRAGAASRSRCSAAGAACRRLAPVGLAARVEAAPRRPALLALAPAPAALWLVAGLGTLLALPVSFQLLDSASLAPAFGGVDPWLLVGVAGALACLVVFMRSGCRFSDDVEDAAPDARRRRSRTARSRRRSSSSGCPSPSSRRACSSRSRRSAARRSCSPGRSAWSSRVAVALIPGCGTQIAFTGLYATGALPFPALLANAVAQDGDALLPVLAHDRRTAFVTTALTSVPALLAGFAFLLL